jgi:hypothetical protein
MQSGKKTLSLVGVALLAALASACIDYPRNGQILATKATTVEFEGWYPASNVEVKLWIWNNSTSTWNPLVHPTILTGTQGLTDNVGDTWYAYGADLVLPQGTQYWAAAPFYPPQEFRKVIAKVKATAPPYDLTTYDVTADQCIEDHRPMGGAAIMQECKSSASPVVSLRVSCGASGNICCLAGPACDFGKNCSASPTSGACTATCGAQGQTCCQASPGCGPNTICQGSSCIHCGSTAEICCPGSTCASGNVCQSNSCVLCGSTGETCCAGNSCDPGNVCQGGSCTLCSGLNQPCCGGNTCSSGLTCTSGICKVPPCGHANEACCPGDVCESTAAQELMCNIVDKCTPCGKEHQSCCHLDVNPPFGCEGILSCMNEPGGYKCECDYTFFPNGCG